MAGSKLIFRTKGLIIGITSVYSFKLALSIESSLSLLRLNLLYLFLFIGSEFVIKLIHIIGVHVCELSLIAGYLFSILWALLEQ